MAPPVPAALASSAHLAHTVIGARSPWAGSFVQYGTDRVGLMHTWYDTVCTKEYWSALLDAAGARRPQQLARWDGSQAFDVGPGACYGRCDLVCKISDSYLGIGDRVLKRGKASGGDFDDLADIQAILQADTQYCDKSAVLSEFIFPAPALGLSSEGFGDVHSLDIVTMRTKQGCQVPDCPAVMPRSRPLPPAVHRARL